MATQTTQNGTRLSTRTPAPSRAGHSLAARVPAALLSLGVAWIHIKDQGGFPGDKTPHYVGLGYYALEAVAVLVAIALLVGPARQRLATWIAAGAVALGPIVGFVLSRGPGLPHYSDDRGNWTETLGLVSLVVEGALLLLSLAVARTLTADRRA